MAGKHQQGFSLVELVAALAVIAVITAIALPIYQGYLATARTGVMLDNIRTIAWMQDERRREFGEFVEGDCIPGGSSTLTTRLGWRPGAGADAVSWQVACVTDGAVTGECAANSGYRVTATHASAPDEPVSRTFTP